MIGSEVPMEERQNKLRTSNSSPFVRKEMFISETKKKMYFCIIFKPLTLQA